MLKYCWYSKVFPDDLVSMHCASITTFLSTHNIGKPRISVNKCSFYLLCNGRFHSVAVNNMRNFETSKTYLSNPPQLVANFVRLIPQFVTNMGIQTVSNPPTNIKCFAIAWVDKPVHVIFQPINYFGRKFIQDDSSWA